MMVLMEIDDLYRRGMLDAWFVRVVNLTTDEISRPRISAVVWLSWSMMDSPTFNRSFIDQYNIATDVQIRRLWDRDFCDNSHDNHAYARARKPISARQVVEEAQGLDRDPAPHNRRDVIVNDSENLAGSNNVPW